jgi:hypothetical protein
MSFIPENLEPWTNSDPACGSTNNYAGGDFSDFYLAPVSITRDTIDSVTLSNWEVITKKLDELTEHEESGITSFSHWVVGWFDIYLIHRSDTEALKCADQWAAVLADYPVADDAHLSELESEAENEAWERYGDQEWRETISKHLAEFAPSDPVEEAKYGCHAAGYWADDVVESLSAEAVFESWIHLSSKCGWSCQHSSDGPSFNFKGPAEMLNIEILSELVGLPLLSPEQSWRREPYQWVDGTSSTLAPTLPLNLGVG